MRKTDPKYLALLNSLLVVAFFSVLFFIFSYIYYEIKWIPYLLIALLIFVFCYIIFRYTLENFIYRKIRVIYKTIHNLKVAKGGKRKKITRSDMIENVNREVLEWEERQKEEINRLNELEDYRREFIGNISHELKTPIFNIQGYILTLLDGGLEDPSINKLYLRRSEKSINRMIAIVEDLETIAQLESRDLKLDMRKFDVVSLTRDVIEFLDMKARKRDVTIFFRENYDKPIYVEADQKRIRQVLINLLDNSIKYGKEEGATTKIGFFDMDENLLVEVTDNGEGINGPDLQRVFERFYRTDKARSRDQGGTGLGLAIVKHIMEAHKQTITVRSKAGLGTTFGFTLRKYTGK